MIVLELELAAMQPGNRRGKTQSQAGARLRTALLEPHEALDRAITVGHGNAAAAVSHSQQDTIALSLRRHNDLRVGTVQPAPVFDGVVDQIGQRLADQLSVAVNRSSRRRLHLEMDALVVGEWLVELTHPARDLGSIAFGHAV